VSNIEQFHISGERYCAGQF